MFSFDFAQKFGRDGLDAMTRSASAMSAGAQSATSETVEYAKRSFEQGRAAPHLSRRGGDGQDGAQDRARAEAGEPVDGAEHEGRAGGGAFYPAREPREGTQLEAAPEELQDAEGDDDQPRD